MSLKNTVMLSEVTFHTSQINRPGMKYAILSRILLSNSCGQQLVSGTCWVQHIKVPRAHSESSSTDKLPDIAIWPWKKKQHIIGRAEQAFKTLLVTSS